MTDAEFKPLVQRLRGAYNMLADINVQQVWLYHLRPYDYRDVCAACDFFIRNSSQRPTIADIINEARRFRSERQRKELADSRYNPFMKARPGSSGRCPVCRNSGLVIREIEGGYEVGRPCTACAFGRLNYPAYFAEAERAEEMKAVARTDAVRDADVVAEPAAFTKPMRREMDMRREAAAYAAPATFTASNVARDAGPIETGSGEQVSLQFDVAERLAYRAAG